MDMFWKKAPHLHLLEMVGGKFGYNLVHFNTKYYNNRKF